MFLRHLMYISYTYLLENRRQPPYAACLSPRRNTSRKMARASGPQYSICQHSAMGILQPQVCTHIPKLGSLNSSVATRLITGHMMHTIISEMA